MFVYLVCPNSMAQTPYDTIWICDTLHLNNDMVVDSGQILCICPGARIVSHGHFKLLIHGNIRAIGTPQDTITFTVADTTSFADTSTLAGGWHGIHLQGYNNQDTAIFRYCKLEYGKTTSGTSGEIHSYPEDDGGGMFVHHFHALIIQNSLIQHNWSKFNGGGIYTDTVKYLMIESCSFIQNKTFHFGGGIYHNAKFQTVTIIQNNLFRHNTVFNVQHTGGWVFQSGAGSGIAIPLYNSGNITIRNNFFFNNKTLTGTIYDNSFGSLITTNIICNNYGISIFNGDPVSHSFFSNNIIVNNYNYLSTAGIRAAFEEDGSILNNIIWGNETWIGELTQIELSGNPNHLPLVEYNCVQYGFDGEGNIDQYPLFTNPSPGAGLDYPGWLYDWSLRDSSPCINRATPDTNGLMLPSHDAYGNPRFFGGRLDMGAIENQHVWVSIPNPLVAAQKITVYPNPSSETLFIDIPPNFTGYHITLYDLLGKPLREAIIHTSPAIFMVADLTPGIYYWVITGDHGIMASEKWVKR